MKKIQIRCLGSLCIHFLWVFGFHHFDKVFFLFSCISTHFNPGKVWMWILWLPMPAKSPINCRSWTASPSHALPRNSSKWMRLLVMSVTRKWKRGQWRLPDDTEWLTKIHWKPSYPLDCAWKKSSRQGHLRSDQSIVVLRPTNPK